MTTKEEFMAKTVHLALMGCQLSMHQHALRGGNILLGHFFENFCV